MAALAGIKSNILLAALDRWPLDAGTLTWQSGWYIAKVAGQSRWPFTQGTGGGRYYCTTWVRDKASPFAMGEF